MWLGIGRFCVSCKNFVASASKIYRIFIEILSKSDRDSIEILSKFYRTLWSTAASADLFHWRTAIGGRRSAIGDRPSGIGYGDHRSTDGGRRSSLVARSLGIPLCLLIYFTYLAYLTYFTYFTFPGPKHCFDTKPVPLN